MKLTEIMQKLAAIINKCSVDEEQALIQAIRIAAKELEREPQKSESTNKIFYCPRCGEGLLENTEKYCPNCGQHIKWGGSEK